MGFWGTNLQIQCIIRTNFLKCVSQLKVWDTCPYVLCVLILTNWIEACGSGHSQHFMGKKAKVVCPNYAFSSERIKLLKVETTNKYIKQSKKADGFYIGHHKYPLLFSSHLVKVKFKCEPREERKTFVYVSSNRNRNSTFNSFDECKINLIIQA